MKKYKITERFPQATVVIEHTVVCSESELEDAKQSPDDFAVKSDTKIDFGGEAHTLSVEEIK